MIKRYILSAVVGLMAATWSMAQNDALVVERHNGRADIFTVSTNLKIVNQSDNDSIIITEGDNILASFARADVKRIAFEEESILTDSVERAALIALYKATDGDNWTENTNWCSDKNLNQWYGVTTENDRVTEINLMGNQLSGEIPAELGNLTGLKNLYLNHNNLVGQIPIELCHLIRLKNLRLEYNTLTGSIPTELCNLTYLETLRLGNNDLTGVIPREISKLKKLKDLYLLYTYLSGEIPSELYELTELEDLEIGGIYYLGLSEQHLTGTLPKSISNLKKLRTLMIYNTGITGPIPPEIGELTELSCIELPENRLTGSIPSELGKLARLRRLWLGGNELTGEIPSGLGNLTELRSLHLEDNKLTGEIPESFNNLKGLIYHDSYINDYAFSIETYNNNLSGKIPSIFCDSPAWAHEWIFILSNNSFYNLDDIYIPAPSFHVKDIDGNILDSKEIYPKNKYTAIFHWATWCGFSQSLMQVMIPLYERYKDYGLDIIGLCEGEAERTIRDYVAQNGIKWRNFISKRDNMLDYISTFSSPASGYPRASTPELTLIDSNGRVVFTDCINDRYKITEFLRERLGEGNIVDAYASTDYSRDGYVETLQTAATEKDIKVVIIGDGYSDRLVNDHTYRTAMLKAKDALFATEPMNSYRDRFTVKYVTAVSENEYIGENSHTALSCYFGEGTHVGGDNAKVFEYARKAISEDDMDDALIIVIMNEPRWAGTCYMYQPEKKSDWGSGATIAYVPNIGYTGMIEYQTFETLLAHEAIGHGFVKLGDEYEEHSEPIPAEEKEKYQSEVQYGWWKNTDFTSDPTKVKWSDFITDDRYKDEGIGVYEGALTYSSGAYRPTQKSIMTSTETEFNAPSREAIWYRINKLTQGEGWEGTHEDFVAFDQQVMPARVQARRAPNEKAGSRIIRGAPPIVKGHTWRMEK